MINVINSSSGVLSLQADLRILTIMFTHPLSSFIAKRSFVVLDTETTGFYYDGGDEIVELAAEKLVGNSVVATFHALVRPTIFVPKEAVAIHGLDNEFLRANGREAVEVFPEFATFIDGAVLVGHNIRRFDSPFLPAHYPRLNLPLPKNELLDTLELARSLLDLPNHKLGTVAAHFAIPTVGAHPAAADVAITREVLLRLFAHVD